MPFDMSIYQGIYFNYYVMFTAQTPVPYSPFLPLSFNVAPGNEIRMHSFDPEIEGVLPALWYCLHLPRNGFDTQDISPLVYSRGFSIPHSIMLIPSYITDEQMNGLIAKSPPTIVIGQDDCMVEANKLSTAGAAPLGCVSISSLSQILLKRQWATLTQLVLKLPLKGHALTVVPSLLPKKARSILPITFMTNQLKQTPNFLKALRSHGFSFESRLRGTVHIRSVINTLADFEKRRVFEPTDEDFFNKFAQNKETTKVPVVITLSGTAARIRPRKSGSKVQEIGPKEKEVIDFLGVYRATARGGVWLDGGTLTTQLFSELQKLEDHCRAPEQSNRFVWDSLKRIGKKIAKQLGQDGPDIVHQASQIIAFSDFPIGLGILPGLSDPLCCMKPISYRPLSPLTRSLQFELPRLPEIFIGRELKILIVECLSPDDVIRPLSDKGWDQVQELFTSSPRVEIVYQEVRSLEALKELLSTHSDSQLMVISAHGHYADDQNIAGLCIGDSVWMASEDDIQVPPIVILSACHVAPRGLGAVTVNDLLLRAGAKVVIGTLIPVNVQRNAVLTGRLFIQIAEALAGRGRFRSLVEAWQWVVCSNAINEILDSSDRLLIWANTVGPNGIKPIEDFMLNQSNGRLRAGTVYSDSVAVLREIASESGMREHLDAVLSSQGYFPESCFYTITGFPENVVLTDEAKKV